MGTGARLCRDAPFARRTIGFKVTAMQVSENVQCPFCGQRFELVIDTSTGRGLPGACVSLGPCTAGAPHTDAFGRWTLDLPVGSGGLNWGLEFAKDSYTWSTLNVRSRTGYIFLPTQRLSPTG